MIPFGVIHFNTEAAKSLFANDKAAVVIQGFDEDLNGELVVVEIPKDASSPYMLGQKVVCRISGCQHIDGLYHWFITPTAIPVLETPTAIPVSG